MPWAPSNDASNDLGQVVLQNHDSGSRRNRPPYNDLQSSLLSANLNRLTICIMCIRSYHVHCCEEAMMNMKQTQI